ncbi:TraB/GumN family protein [Aurantiacibacter sp. MUD61]|uniref:TraB/GumN family protein n=1 Tax=Aurantiacibacter sp. MUD61 TaxID=3009083 RepID=UPI0022EFFDBE|nr:TraB/GumN family protein [Aurantiacibacter sp. MUD61]
MTSPEGERGWLFGTVHALPDGVAWYTAPLDTALSERGVLILEIADYGRHGGAEWFRLLGMREGLTPLTQRFPEEERAQVRALLDRADMDEEDLRQSETWVAAITLSNAVREGDAGNGVDRTLRDRSDTVIGLETTRSQLSIFDELPEEEQQDLLLAVAEAAEGNSRDDALRAWLTGDMVTFAQSAEQGITSDPELRAALHTNRNLAWLPAIREAIEAGDKPFVAVGAAHMLGEDGLPALLEAEGYTVTRIQ